MIKMKIYFRENMREKHERSESLKIKNILFFFRNLNLQNMETSPNNLKKQPPPPPPKSHRGSLSLKTVPEKTGNHLF